MCSDLHNVVRESKGKVLLSVRVQPRSRQNAMVGFRDKSLLLKVTAPPIDGAANEAVIKVLSRALRLPKRTVTVLQGVKSRDKTVWVEDISVDDLLVLLEKYF